MDLSMLGVTGGVKVTRVIAAKMRSTLDPCNAPCGAPCMHDAESVVQPCCQYGHGPLKTHRRLQ